VSVLVAAYDSHGTLRGLLEALRHQTFGDFETIVVDSGPSPASGEICRDFPEVTYLRSDRRLLPQQAREFGLKRARADVIVFTDADVYPDRRWLERALAAHLELNGAPIVGALTCHGTRWLDRGIHLCKFSKWLPAGERRQVDMGPTANLLLSRASYQRCRGLEEDPWLGDVTLSWNLLAQGERLWFEPRAIVAHHHLTGLGAFLRERRVRGEMFSPLLARRNGMEPAAIRRRWLATVLPARLVSNLGHSLRHALGAGQGFAWWLTLPVHAAGWIATLLGEERGLRRLLQVSSPAAAPSSRNA
jgi:glycosyltransferase involved in cell wall biosynthesis